jgi:uncharacterized membrane protein YeaQ/YmgE (transglycosylase-associated protein family)
MKITALIVGAIMGFLASVLQAFFNVIPPPAYGVCIACHMRDVVNWIVAHLYPIYGYSKGLLKIPGGPISYHFPLLTIVGILIGATIAARIHKEFRWKTMRVAWQRPWVEFFWGMALGEGPNCGRIHYKTYCQADLSFRIQGRQPLTYCHIRCRTWHLLDF